MSRAYPPDYCSAETMAYLLDMGKSTFLDYVKNGYIPDGNMICNKRLWNRTKVLDAMDNNSNSDSNVATPDSIQSAFSGKQKAQNRVA